MYTCHGAADIFSYSNPPVPSGRGRPAAGLRGVNHALRPWALECALTKARSGRRVGASRTEPLPPLQAFQLGKLRPRELLVPGLPEGPCGQQGEGTEPRMDPGGPDPQLRFRGYFPTWKKMFQELGREDEEEKGSPPSIRGDHLGRAPRWSWEVSVCPAGLWGPAGLAGRQPLGQMPSAPWEKPPASPNFAKILPCSAPGLKLPPRGCSILERAEKRGEQVCGGFHPCPISAPSRPGAGTVKQRVPQAPPGPGPFPGRRTEGEPWAPRLRFEAAEPGRPGWARGCPCRAPPGARGRQGGAASYLKKSFLQ